MQFSWLVTAGLLATTALAGAAPTKSAPGSDDDAKRFGDLLTGGGDPMDMCRCNAPADVDERIRKADELTAASFKTALATRKLVLDAGEVIDLEPDDKADHLDDGAAVTIKRGKRRIKVRVYRERSLERPELVLDARKVRHVLIRAETGPREIYDRCDQVTSGGGSVAIGGAGYREPRVGYVIDGMGAPITLRYRAHHVYATFCKKR